MNTMCDAFLERRFGRFEIAAPLLQTTELDHLNLIFRDMVIYSAAYDESRNVMSYYACSPHFEPIDVNGVPPDYAVIVRVHKADIGGHSHQVTYERVSVPHAA